MLYTILAGAKHHRIEPWAYVHDLLLRLHAEDSQLEEMLPDRWAAAYPEAISSGCVTGSELMTLAVIRVINPPVSCTVIVGAQCAAVEEWTIPTRLNRDPC